MISPVLVCALVAAFDGATNPATMGANALPAFGAEAPWSKDHTRFSLGGRYTAGRAGDRALTPTFRLDVPFFGVVTAIFDGTPFEAWWAPAATRAVLTSTQAEGFSKGDIRFGAKFLVYDGGRGFPSFGFRFLTKTTTGKDRAQRRFTDSPGYLLDVLLGHRVQLTDDSRLELALAVGFFAWQQSFGQNDAVHYGAAATYFLREVLETRLGVRGYIGWQRNDKPIDLDLGVTWFATSWFGLYAEGSVGFVHAPEYAVGAGFTFRIPLTVPLQREN